MEKNILEITETNENKIEFKVLRHMVLEYSNAKTPLGILIMKHLNIKNFIEFHKIDKKQQYDELITRYREDK